MRVLEVAASGQLGGAERVLLECQRGLSASGCDVSVLALDDGPLLDVVRQRGLRASAVAMPASLAAIGDAHASSARVAMGLVRTAPALLRYSRRFSRELTAAAPALIHSHGIKTHLLTAVRASPVPLVWHLHDYLSMRSLSARLLSRLASRCALVIAVSKSVACDARRCLPGDVPIAVLHNAVDVEQFRPDGPRADLDALAGLPPALPETVRVGLAGTFARWKGHDVFLRAIARIHRPGVRAYVVGGPLYRTGDSQWSDAELRTMARDLGLAQVGFTGFVDDMAGVYRSLDVVVHASTRPEPFGLVIAEAMACGRAVIASQAGGAAELFEPGESAVGLHPVDDATLASAIDMLSCDADQRARLGRRAREHVMSRFGREQFAHRLRATLSTVVPEFSAAG